MKTEKLSICINSNGARFGALRDTDIAALSADVREFVDIDRNVIFVDKKNINSVIYVDGADNVYVLKELIDSIKNADENKIFENFSSHELETIVDFYNRDEVDFETAKQAESHISNLIKFRLDIEKQSGEDEME